MTPINDIAANSVTGIRASRRYIFCDVFHYNCRISLYFVIVLIFETIWANYNFVTSSFNMFIIVGEILDTHIKHFTLSMEETSGGENMILQSFVQC